MEWLLFLLLGSVAASVGVWSAMGGKKEERPYAGEAPGKEGGPAGGPEPTKRGRRSSDPIKLGEEEEEALPREAPEEAKGKGVPSREKPGSKPEEEAERGGVSEQLPYKTDDIIPRGSTHAHHRRALQNAENLANRGKLDEASALFERIKKRIPDEDIQNKIQENLNALKAWKSGEGAKKEKEGGVFSMGAEQMAMQQFGEGLRSIAEGIVGQLMYGFPGISSGYAVGPSPMDQIREKAGAPPPFLGEMAEAGPDWRSGVRAGGLPEGVTLNEDGELVTEGWTDEDFEREWEKYRNLPLKNRRIERDRRDHEGAEIDERRDRRSGDDRRQKDLFRERDEFLEKLENHKRNKQLLSEFEKKKEEEDRREELSSAYGQLSVTSIDMLDDTAIMIKYPVPSEEEQASLEGEPSEGVELTGGVPSGLPSPEQAEGEKGEAPGEKAGAEGEKPEGREEGGGMGSVSLAQPGPFEELEPIKLPEPLEISPEEGEEEAEGLPEGIPGMEGGVPSLGGAEGFEGEEEGVPELGGEEGEKEKEVQEIRGVLELKPPEEEDTPYLSLTYDFARIPDSFKLSADYHTMEYAYYKYKPMLIKAQEFTRRKMLKNALNYYRVIKSQNIPPEFKRMINRNIQDITEYLEKFLMGR